jgi:hypothetical protein
MAHPDVVQVRGILRPRVLDFIAETAKGMAFTDHKHTDGLVYRNLALTMDTKFELSMVENIEAKIGSIQEGVSFVRRAFGDDTTTSWIHADHSMSQYAGLVYLSDAREGCGTAFWKHKELGYTSANELKNQEEVDIVRRDAEDRDKWEMLHFEPTAKGKFVYYPTHLFHSRMPQFVNHLKDEEEARYVWVLFFDKIP